MKTLLYTLILGLSLFQGFTSSAQEEAKPLGLMLQKSTGKEIYINQNREIAAKLADGRTLNGLWRLESSDTVNVEGTKAALNDILWIKARSTTRTAAGAALVIIGASCIGGSVYNFGQIGIANGQDEFDNFIYGVFFALSGAAATTVGAITLASKKRYAIGSQWKLLTY